MFDDEDVIDSDEVCDYCDQNEYELKEFDGDMLCPQCIFDAEMDAEFRELEEELED